MGPAKIFHSPITRISLGFEEGADGGGTNKGKHVRQGFALQYQTFVHGRT